MIDSLVAGFTGAPENVWELRLILGGALLIAAIATAILLWRRK